MFSLTQNVWLKHSYNPRGKTDAAFASAANAIPMSTDSARRKLMVDQLVCTAEDNKRVVQAHAKIAVEKSIVQSADMCGLVWHCKATDCYLPVRTMQQLRLAWFKDGHDDNIKRMAWMFYYYPYALHNHAGSNFLTLVEEVIMATMNITYGSNKAGIMIPGNNSTSIQQTVTVCFNRIRANLLRSTNKCNTHKCILLVEKPKKLGFGSGRRTKTTFYVTSKDSLPKEVTQKLITNVNDLPIQHFSPNISYLAQVDYAQDPVWAGWNRTALRVLLYPELICDNVKNDIKTSMVVTHSVTAQLPSPTTDIPMAPHTTKQLVMPDTPTPLTCNMTAVAAGQSPPLCLESIDPTMWEDDPAFQHAQMDFTGRNNSRVLKSTSVAQVAALPLFELQRKEQTQQVSLTASTPKMNNIFTALETAAARLPMLPTGPPVFPLTKV